MTKTVSSKLIPTRCALAPVVASALLLPSPAVSFAATLCVHPAGTGGCFATVQEAVDVAGGGDVIEIAAGTHAIAAKIELRATLTLQGAGADATVLDRGGSGDVLLVGEREKITVRDLTLQDGDRGVVALGNSKLFLEGIRIREMDVGLLLDRASQLTLSNSTIRDCAGLEGNAIGYFFQGPGLPKGAGRVDITDSSIVDNFGVGIRVAKTRVHVERSTIRGNAQGGIRDVHRSKIDILDSTISDNGEYGVVGHVVTARNSTISQNGSDGIRLGERGRASLVGMTIAGNGGFGVGADGGGKIQLSNSILSGNAGGDCGPDALWLSRDYNLLQDDCMLVGRTAQTQTGIDALLGPLADNGGPTPTHALLTGSPAIDAGDPGATKTKGFRCHPTDQRGVPRNGRCDIGAFEF